MIGRTNAKRGGSGNVTTVTLSSGASGETVTATRTGKSKTAVTDSNGVATFKNLDMGYDWTFTWGTFSVTEKIDQLNESILLGAILIPFYGKQSGTNYPSYANQGDAVVEIYHGSSDSGELIFTTPGFKSFQYLGDVPLIPGDTYYIKVVYGWGGDGIYFLKKNIDLTSTNPASTGTYVTNFFSGDSATIVAEEVSNYAFEFDD